MKQRIILLAFILLGLNASAQTLNVKKDNVVYQFPAAQAADMWYTDGKTLTIMDKTFTLSELTKMYVDFSAVTDNQVDVAYNGGSATVYIAGNIAQYVDATEESGHVVVNQLSNVGDDTCGEITYHLSGSCPDGQFYMTGSYKASVELDGLTLTNPSGAAINIQNGKRISVSVKKDTENTLTDGSENADKGCFVCKGHTELKGKGVLNVKSLAACAIWSKEYIEMKNCTVNVTGAAKDGVNCNQYMTIESGSLTVSNVSDDGIQVSYESDGTDTEDTGCFTLIDGTVNVTVSGDAVKGIKADKDINIQGGSLTVIQSGNIVISDTDVSYPTSLKADGDFNITGGTVNITNSGQAGRGISAMNVTTDGGTLTITNTGAGVQGSSDNYTAKCIKADTSVKLNSGTITLKASGTGGKGIKSDGTFTQGLSDGSGPVFTVTTTGSSLGSSSSGGGGWGGWGGPGGGGFGPGGGGQSSSGSSAKAVKVQGTATIYGGESTYSTSTDGAEGLETKQGNIDIQGGKHYFKCYDDCINTASAIIFNGGVTVCWSTGNDAIDSNYGRSGAITIGNGAALTYTSKGSPEEGFDCDNNSYIQITGTGIGLSAGGAQGGGSSSSISGAAQGYYLNTNTMSYNTSYYYTLADANGNNLVTYKFPTSINSTLSLITAKGMVKGSKYYLTYSTTAPTDATTAFQGLYLGSSAKGTTEAKFFKNGSTSVNYFTAQ